ncbi:hypothetical protein ACNVED_07125 [Legionella sp. D16C41]|uniref:hypothetical protein n=1 Tax=Legionella sp. D16C41 TaxID=3402688 RepID=UPI003AF67F4A
MHTVNLAVTNPEYLKFLQTFEEGHKQERLHHAFLLQGSSTASLTALYGQMITTLLCKETNRPCGVCKSCLLIKHNEHPDLYQIKPEKPGTAIKVEQIRELHNYLYTSSQVAKSKVILILHAERMNRAAANSLLKMLEEPPNGIYFILIIESISQMPATILSRCQKWYFTDFNFNLENYIAQFEQYNVESSLATLLKQKELFLDDLINIKKKQVSINAIAEKWSVYDLNDLTRFIYLIIAQMIHNYFSTIPLDSNISFKLEELTRGFKITSLFTLLDKLNQASKNLSYSITINQLLTLEDLLLSFLCE